MVSIPSTRPQPQEQETQNEETIVVIEENLKFGFTQSPRPVNKAKGLSWRAKCIYTRLLDYARDTDHCYPGQTRLAVDLGKSVDTIQRGLKELKAYGLIKVVRRGLNKTNVYFICKIADCEHLQGELTFLSTGKPQNCANQTPQNCGNRTPQNCGTNDTKSIEMHSEETKFFENASKGRALTSASACSHIAGGTIGNGTNGNTEATRNSETARTSDRETEAGTTKPTQGNRNRNSETPTVQGTGRRQLRLAQTRTAPSPATIGKPMTQDEIDEKRKRGLNASGVSPLAQIPASHLDELQKAFSGSTPPSARHYHRCTKAAPFFIQAIIEEFALLLHDEEQSIPQDINRAAKLYRQAGLDEDTFRDHLHDAFITVQRKTDIQTLHSDGRPNKMRYFFSVLEDKVGIRPKQP
jgi:hypothetical protein